MAQDSPRDPDAPPNIVFIMADDMGYGDPGCYGATKIPTPNMDRLAEDGVRCTDAHSASAVCTPSRYAVVTGRYCWRSRLQKWVLWGFEPPLVEPERPTVASLLKQSGYATAAIGKWHLGLGWTTKDGRPAATLSEEEQHALDTSDIDFGQPITGGPNALGFDYFFGITGSLDMTPYCFIEDDRTVGIPSLEKDPCNPQQRPGLMVPGWRDELVDQTFAEKAVDFIEHQPAQQPFFLYLTPSAPHRPCVPPDFIAGRSQAGLRGDMVAMVDWMVGEVMAALDRRGASDNTLLIVTSDNGARLTCYDGNDYGHKSCGDLRGQKADIWDGGHREPFIARWPARIPPGTTSAETICLVDLMATCAAIVGAPLPDNAGEDSFDILPTLLGQSAETDARPALVHHSGDGMFSLRQGPWKLILGLGSGGFSKPARAEPEPGGPEGQLYNLDQDPAETDDLWAQRPDIVESMTTVLVSYREQGRSRPLG